MTIYRALLHRFELICDDRLVDNYLRPVLAPLREATPGQSQVTRYELLRDDASGQVTKLLADGREVTEGRAGTGPVGRFLGHLDRAGAEETGIQIPVLHAAACHRQGRTIVVPGAPNAGKSTLMAHLALRGWTYLSDELVGIVPGDPPTMLAYPRAIVLDPGSWSLFAERTLEPPQTLSQQLPPRRHLIPPADALPPAAASYPITDVVLYRWRSGGSACVDELDAADCLRALLGSAFSLQRDPQRDLDLLARVIDGAQCRRVSGGPAQEVEDLLLGAERVR